MNLSYKRSDLGLVLPKVKSCFGSKFVTTLKIIAWFWLDVIWYHLYQLNFHFFTSSVTKTTLSVTFGRNKWMKFQVKIKTIILFQCLRSMLKFSNLFYNILYNLMILLSGLLLISFFPSADQLPPVPYAPGIQDSLPFLETLSTFRHIFISKLSWVLLCTRSSKL